MRFSVIIPLYNKALYVAKAIESVLSQTSTDFELVIVDDGSNDNSAGIAAQAIEDRANCCLVKQGNQGVSMARNNGAAFSKGEYLCFLDADDWWDPTFLEEMSRFIDEFPEAGIYGTNYTIINETKHKTRVAKIGVEEGFEKGYINYCQAYTKTMYMPLWTGAVCIPRIVFDEMQGFPQGIKLGEDFLLWVHIALKHKVVLLNKSLAFYNQDLDPNKRSVGKLYKPQEHMLWNLKDLEPLEAENENFKCLVDALRVTGLMPYFLSKTYRSMAQTELNKVDWSKQLKKYQKLYKQPVAWLKLKYGFRRIGSQVKTKLLSLK